jgi:hypothetical protein
LATAKRKPQRSRAAQSSEAATPDGAREGRGMTLVKQASVVVGLISAAVGLVFLVFPQFRPERGQSSPEQSASVDRISPPNQHTTKGDFLDYMERSKLGLTKQQLQEVGASAFATMKIVGYKGRALTIVRQIVDARTGHAVGEAADITVTPPKDHVEHPWGDWARLRPGRGSYIMVIKLLDGPVGQPGVTVIACGQTGQFGGRAGFTPVKTPPHVCQNAGSG